MFSVGIVIRSLFRCFYLSSIGFVITVNEGGCKMVFHLPFKVYKITLSAKMCEINAHFYRMWSEKGAKDLMIHAEYLQRHISTRKKT